jgi:hypothetical protein
MPDGIASPAGAPSGVLSGYVAIVVRRRRPLDEVRNEAFLSHERLQQGQRRVDGVALLLTRSHGDERRC